MARPRKCRRVCQMPENQKFGPLGASEYPEEFVIMGIDEFETIRLIDLEGFTQEECSEKMEVARTTVQAIYNSARKKLAELIINGKILRIEGGNYKLCENRGHMCGGYRRRGSCAIALIEEMLK